MQAKFAKWTALGFAMLLSASAAQARQHAAQPAFKYVGGTIGLPEHCKGKLELAQREMIFDCAVGSLTIPYETIRHMEYRASISRKVKRMKPRWKVKPETFVTLFGRKGNRYFTIIYQEKDEAPIDVLVLEVSPEAMRPYLAEIDLRVGHRIEVENFDD